RAWKLRSNRRSLSASARIAAVWNAGWRWTALCLSRVALRSRWSLYGHAGRAATRRGEAPRFDRELSGRRAWRTDLRLPRARAGAAATEVGTARRLRLAEGYCHDRCAVQLAADHGELHRPAAL